MLPFITANHKSALSRRISLHQTFRKSLKPQLRNCRTGDITAFKFSSLHQISTTPGSLVSRALAPSAAPGTSWQLFRPRARAAPLRAGWEEGRAREALAAPRPEVLFSPAGPTAALGGKTDFSIDLSSPLERRFAVVSHSNRARPPVRERWLQPGRALCAGGEGGRGPAAGAAVLGFLPPRQEQKRGGRVWVALLLFAPIKKKTSVATWRHQGKELLAGTVAPAPLLLAENG